MKTQIDSPNRQRDAERLAKTHPGLCEAGNGTTRFFEAGTRLLLAVGYSRITFGDHGPYLEFAWHHLNGDAFPRFREKGPRAYYNEAFTAAGTMLYCQRRGVEKLPNPPAGRWSCNNNRPEGYANYRPGYFYINPDRVFCE